jgi:hypothetical protein
MSVKPFHFVVLALLLAVALLSACGGDAPPDLVIPTVAATADPNRPPTGVAAVSPTAPPTQTLPAPVTSVLATATATPTTSPPTAVLPSATPLPPTPTLAPTAAPPTATPTPPQAVAPVYRVAFVAANDTLNVRRRADADSAVVGQLSPDATGITVAGEGQPVRGGGEWLPVDTAAGSGYVNSRFLTEQIDRAAFCADPAVNDLLNRLQTAIATEDAALLGELVHPTRGLRLRLNWWNEEVIVREEAITDLFRDRPRDAVNWGTNEGSGQTIRGTFSDVMLPFLTQDLLGATQWACDELLYGPTAGLITLPEGYGAVNFYSAYRAAPAGQEFDWGTWAIGIERWQGRYYISYLIHYRYEI